MTVQPTLLTLQINDLPDVAEIHVRAFPKSALSRLGKETVRRYYEWQMIGPHDLVATGAYLNGVMAGFCFAGTFNGAISGFLRRNRTYLAWQALTHFWLFSDELFRSRAKRGIQIFTRYLRPGANPSLPVTGASSNEIKREFGILSIATHPEFQGKGIGKFLMAANERIALERGFETMGLNVSCDNEQAIRFYQSQGWQKIPGDEGIWKGKMRKFFAQEIAQ
jgi:ribosomal protein S18 acetylase RimI-like enzyme